MEQVFFGQIPIILSGIYIIVEFSSVAGLLFDLLCHFSAGVNPMTLELPEDCIEAALLEYG
jgi:hypothetical protein